jgi:hypothetical protein
MRIPCIILIWAISGTPLFAQKQDSISVPLRDPVGDLNARIIREGKFPGAIKLPGKQVSAAFGGLIKATAFYDSKYKVKEELILPGQLNANNTDKGQFFSGARSSRLYFDGRTDVQGVDAQAYIEMDFRGPNGITLRHIYLRLQNNKGQSLIMGQYWTNIMDLAYIPPTVIEPYLGGTPLARQGQIRFTTSIGKQFTFSASIEDSDNSDVFSTDHDELSQYPDFTAKLEFDPSDRYHLSFSGMYRTVQQSSQIDGSIRSQPAIISQLGMNIIIDKEDILTLVGGYSNGAGRYLPGSDRVNGFALGNEMQLHESYGGFVSYRRFWSEKWRSMAFLCLWNVDELEDAPYTSFKSSTSFTFNTIYRLSEYVNIGIEYSYITNDDYAMLEFDNHRVMFGIQVF